MYVFCVQKHFYNKIKWIMVHCTQFTLITSVIFWLYCWSSAWDAQRNTLSVCFLLSALVALTLHSVHPHYQCNILNMNTFMPSASWTQVQIKWVSYTFTRATQSKSNTRTVLSKCFVNLYAHSFCLVGNPKLSSKRLSNLHSFVLAVLHP